MHLVRDTTVTTLYNTSPLLNTKWHQGSPYNDLCPYTNIHGVRKAAGCVPIAIGQFLNYHQWPNTNVINNESFSWTLISQNYYRGNPSSLAKQEVAKFTYNIGVSTGADYENLDSVETSANLISLVLMLNHFNISNILPRTIIANGTNYVHARDILINKGPFCMKGEDPDYNKGHAWVADGWKEYVTTITHTWYNNSTGAIEVQMEVSSETTTLMHCNMGWGGLCDGYYNGTMVGFDTTQMLDPENIDTTIGDEASASSHNYNYNYNLLIIGY